LRLLRYATYYGEVDAWGLLACANNDIAAYKAPLDITSTTAATLTVGHIETGFLYFGITDIRLVSVDGQTPMREQTQNLLLAPGAHTIIIRAFRDPIAAFACINFTFEAGKAYVAQTTKPEMESTTMWLEDKSSGEVVSKKVPAQMGRDPLMWGPALKALFLNPVSGPCQPA
jgi:hypothetical protein